MTSILISGVAGFIGSHAAQLALKDGYEVVGIDNLSTGNKANLSFIKKNISFKKGDITNSKFVKKNMKNIDYVLHFAALPSVPFSVKHPMETHNVNVNGTLNVLKAAADEGVKKLVFSSSAAVYGDTKKLPVKESDNLNPLSPYATHKIIGEYYCKLFNNIYGLRTTSFRYFNVFGQRQDPNSAYAAVVPKFISLMKQGKRPVIFGDGLQTRDFISVKSVVKANLLALKNKKSDGQVYNIASGNKTSVLDLIKQINDILEINIKPVFAKARFGDIKHSYASISKTKQDLKFKPLMNFKNGLKDLLI